MSTSEQSAKRLLYISDLGDSHVAVVEKTPHGALAVGISESTPFAVHKRGRGGGQGTPATDAYSARGTRRSTTLQGAAHGQHLAATFSRRGGRLVYSWQPRQRQHRTGGGERQRLWRQLPATSYFL